YTFDQYTELQQARPRGRRAFGDALAAMQPAAPADDAARLRADFEAASGQELFRTWWGTSPVAKFVRQEVESGLGAGSGRVEAVLGSLLHVPIDLGTALLLSFFICIDFCTVRRAVRGLRQTWLRDVYDEMAPALSSLGTLIGRAMHAQG